MQDLSRKEIFEALECCLNFPCVKCHECPLKDDDVHECRQTILIETLRYITYLEDENKLQKKRLQNQINEITRLQCYEKLVNDITDDLTDYFNKALIEIFTPSKEGEQNE